MEAKLNHQIVIDVDGVMLDWFDGFTSFMVDTLHVCPSVSSCTMYNLSDMYPGCDVSKCIAAFNRSPEFGDLKPLDKSVAGVHAVVQAYGRNNVGWLSSCVPVGLDVGATIFRRYMNIFRHFGSLKGECLVIGIPKSERLGPGVEVVIEDSLDNAVDIISNSSVQKVILLDRPYNQGAAPHGVIRVDNWDAVLNELQMMHNREYMRGVN